MRTHCCRRRTLSKVEICKLIDDAVARIRMRLAETAAVAEAIAADNRRLREAMATEALREMPEGRWVM